MKWISSDGGPHILMERRFMEKWEGPEIPANRRIVHAKSRINKNNPIATDYDLACDVHDFIGIIGLQDGNAIVINDDVPMSAWIKDKNGNNYIVVLYTWEGSDYSIEIPKLLNGLNHDAFIDSEIIFKTLEPELFLFPACDIPMKPIYEIEKIILKPAGYSILRLDSYCINDNEIRIFKFQEV